MKLIPNDVLLSWPTPNYDNPVTRGEALVVVNSIFITLVIIVVGLRLYTRLWIKRWFGTDDFFIALALLFTIGLTAVVMLANKSLGWDRHVYDIPFNKLAANLKVAVAAKLMFTAAATTTRLSILCFYYRLVEDSGKTPFLWAVHVNMALTVAIFLTFVCLSIFQCHPVNLYWTYGAPPGSCLDEGPSTLIPGILNCFADFLCTATPIPLVMKLHMPRKQRYAVVVLFSLGFAVTIAGVVRSYYIYKSLYNEYDQTWFAYPLWISAAIEIDLGVICASAPVLRTLISRPARKTDDNTTGISSDFSTKRPSGNFSKITSNNRPGPSSRGNSTSGFAVNATTTSIPLSTVSKKREEREDQVELQKWNPKVSTKALERRSINSEDALYQVFPPMFEQDSQHGRTSQTSSNSSESDDTITRVSFHFNVHDHAPRKGDSASMC